MSGNTIGRSSCDASGPSSPKPGRCLRIAAIGCPAVDVLAGVALLSACGSSNALGPLQSFGWTAHAPLAVLLLRLALLLGTALGVVLYKQGGTLESSADSGGSQASCLATVCWWLEVVFPYVSYTLLASICIARLIGDQPIGITQRDDWTFWCAVVLDTVCTAVETSCTMPMLPELRKLAPWRRGAREIDARVELLSVADNSSPNRTLTSSITGSPTTSRLPTGSPVTGRPSAGSSRPSGSTELQGNENKKASITQLARLVTEEWPLLIQASVFLALAAIADAFIPKFISATISQIVRAEEQGTLASRPFKQPVVYLLITAVCCGVFSACRGGTFIIIGKRVAIRLRQSVFDSLLSQEIGFFDTTKTGELTSRMTQDCQKVSDQITLNVNVFLRTIVSTCTTLVFMYMVSPPLTAVSFVSVPVIVVLSKKYGGVMRDLSEKTQKALADANAVAEEGLSTMSTVRMFAAEGLESKRFAAKLADFGVVQTKQAQYYLFYLSSTMILPQAVTALVLFYGGKLVMHGQVEADQLLSFVFYLQTLNSNFSVLGDFWTNIVQALGAGARVFALRSREPKLPVHCPLGEANQLPNGELGGVSLQFHDVRFSYPAREDVEVLKGLTLEIPAGQVVALVGPSGNGKSTVIGLLKRLYKAQSGSVTLDGKDVWTFHHEEFHRAVSIVGQEPVLFARTIQENIKYGLENPGVNPDASSVPEDFLHEVSRKANAHEFITKMPNGYETEVGERGVQLSGGQKQRIAIARALVRKPKVLLLDEATSALDAESEHQVQQAIDSMIAEGGMTVVIIAHRLSTVMNSHKICVIQGGAVVEEGPHHELIGLRGAYFNLVQCQLSKADVH